MRRAGNSDDDIHVQAQVDGVAGLGVVFVETETAFFIDADLAEEIHRRDQIAPGQAVFADFDQQSVLAGAVHAVAMLLVVVCAILGVHAFGIEQQPERVVPAQAVGGDGRHCAAHVAHQHMAARVVRGVLRLQRIGHVVTFQLLFGVVQHQREIRAVALGGQAQRNAARQTPGPVTTAGNGFFPEQFVLGDGGWGMGHGVTPPRFS